MRNEEGKRGKVKRRKTRGTRDEAGQLKWPVDTGTETGLFVRKTHREAERDRGRSREKGLRLNKQPGKQQRAYEKGEQRGRRTVPKRAERREEKMST
ncbi:hypothetical protein WR25_25539 [Diploscapter pachys]|uniref:Uncharacterized protein n=1 Tax=Diploscapter pachys TaxID=2018661 RepID=A0A2A2JFN6_9BILA|nr:hypothetical protein WR25_25539 [Diploscapter pachys]